MNSDSDHKEESPFEKSATNPVGKGRLLAEENYQESLSNLLAGVAKRGTPKILRIVVIDNHELFREGMLRLLVMEGEFTPVSGSFAEARPLVQRFWPDLVLLGLGPVKERGMQLAKSLRLEFPQVRLLLLDEKVRTNHVRAALAMKAEGYWTKHASFSKIVAAMQSVASGSLSFCPEVEKHLRKTPSGLRFDPPHERRGIARLTPQEAEFFLLLAEGHSIRHLAGKLGIGEKTAEKRRSRILRKMRVHEVADLTKIAIKEGLLK